MRKAITTDQSFKLLMGYKYPVDDHLESCEINFKLKNCNNCGIPFTYEHPLQLYCCFKCRILKNEIYRRQKVKRRYALKVGNRFKIMRQNSSPEAIKEIISMRG